MTCQMKQVTIVIPNYNGMKYIRECLQTVLSQEKDTPDYCVLVVDNGSTDGSWQMVEQEFKEVELIKLPENTGFCHAVNLGIEKADTPYVILLNNDTKVESGFVKGLVDAIGEDERLFSVSARMLMWDAPELLDGAGDNYNAFGWARARGKGKRADAFDRQVSVFSACGGAAIYRKKILEEIGAFDELHFAYLEDVDLGYRARIYGYRNAYTPRAGVIHYGSASTGSRYNAWKTEAAAANNVYLIYKNMPLLQIVWNLPFLFVGFFTKFLFFTLKGMGTLYLKGFAKGIRKSHSREGRTQKVRFRSENLWNYIKIQLLLYKNFINS